MACVARTLKIPYKDTPESVNEWVDFGGKSMGAVMQSRTVDEKLMPQLKGMGLKDVVYLCENMGLKIKANGRGKVTTQSIAAGQMIAKGQLVTIKLN